MGDSFVEGDILSSDLREKLQLRFGGSGAGFAPMASPLTGFRRTIKTQSKGWDSYNIMQRRNPRRYQRLLLHLGLALPTFGRSLRSLGRFIGPGLPGQLPHGPDPVRQP